MLKRAIEVLEGVLLKENEEEQLPASVEAERALDAELELARGQLVQVKAWLAAAPA